MIRFDMKVQTNHSQQIFRTPRSERELLFLSEHIVVPLGIKIWRYMPQDGSLHMLAFEATLLPGHTKKHQLKHVVGLSGSNSAKVGCFVNASFTSAKALSGGVPTPLAFLREEIPEWLGRVG